jgi:hypothetical protein
LHQTERLIAFGQPGNQILLSRGFERDERLQDIRVDFRSCSSLFDVRPKRCRFLDADGVRVHLWLDERIGGTHRARSLTAASSPLILNQPGWGKPFRRVVVDRLPGRAIPRIVERVVAGIVPGA